MALVTPTVVEIGNGTGEAYKATWAAINTTDRSGVAVDAQSIERSVQVSGTFGASTPSVAIQGSVDGTNYIGLTDPQGNPLAFTAAGLEKIAENVAFIKPVFTGGDGTSDLTVALILRRRSTITV